MNDQDINAAVNRVLAGFNGAIAPAPTPVPPPVKSAASSVEDTVARIVAAMGGSKPVPAADATAPFSQGCIVADGMVTKSAGEVNCSCCERGDCALSGASISLDISDEEVDDQVKRIASSTRAFETKKGKAENEDRVTIDYLGKLDGEPFEGGADNDAQLVLGSGQFIPGFEEQLLGVKAGDEIRPCWNGFPG